MKVLVIGGGGVFGSRLARLLVRDGHLVTLASRRLGSIQTLAAELGCATVTMDRAGDLSPILSVEPDVVVDAAGPFQSYVEDPYRLARFCIEHAFNYLDLSDDGAFTVGISSLDGAAKSAGVFVVSGASSVPAISSAAVVALSGDMNAIDAIETAILPGNRAPRGWSLVAAILRQAGRPLRIWRGGWQQAKAWTEPKRYDLGRSGKRVARLIGAPDLLLFPERFRARVVTFRAGMELPILNWAVSTFTWLHERNILAPSKSVVDFALAAARLLERFGQDRGAMVVRVVGEERGKPVRRTWRLLAEAGDGPFIPATPARALLRKSRIEPGARPCVGELNVDEILSAASDLRVSVEIEPSAPLFECALTSQWDGLPSEVCALHSTSDIAWFVGEASVERGGNFLAQLLAQLFSFPKAVNVIPVTVCIEESEKGETWTRTFGSKQFRSYLSRSQNGGSNIIERFGPLSFEIALQAREGSLYFPVISGCVLGVRLPKWLLPGSETREFVQDGKFHFDVALSAPLGLGLMVRYRGWLAPQAAEKPL